MASQDWNRTVLTNDALRVEVLPGLGGKIASIALVPEGGEFLQQPLRPYAERTPTIPFDQADGSGWDECFPSVGPSEVALANGKSAKIEDHGDLWRIPWTVEEASSDTLRTRVRATSLPIEFSRTLRLEGRTLRAEYTIVNKSDQKVPYGWSLHPLFAVEAFDRIHLPGSVHEVKGTQTRGRLGEPDRTHPWPIATNSLDREPLDLSGVGMAEDDVADKLLLPSPAEGWCALERKGLRAKLTLRWNPADWPWLGLWLCYGGWPPEPGAKKAYTVAIEPCNLPVDALADSLGAGSGSYLEAGATRKWTIAISVENTAER